MKTVFILIAAMLAAAAVCSTTIHVPADQPTIQAGIDAAVNGDRVLPMSGQLGVNCFRVTVAIAVSY